MNGGSLDFGVGMRGMRGIALGAMVVVDKDVGVVENPAID